MRSQKLLLAWGLALLIFISGCGWTTSSSGVDEPKRVLNTYLEGLRDTDIEKIRQCVSYEVYKSWPTDPEELKATFKDQEKVRGVIKAWEFGSDPHYDEINKQAIIQTRITTDKAFYVIDFDLRKNQRRWYVFGAKLVNKSLIKGQKNSTPGSVTGNDFDNFMNQMSKGTFHK